MPNRSKHAEAGPEGVTLSTYLPPPEAEQLRARAAAADRTPAAEIRRALRAWMAESTEDRQGVSA